MRFVIVHTLILGATATITTAVSSGPQLLRETTDALAALQDLQSQVEAALDIPKNLTELQPAADTARGLCTLANVGIRRDW